MPRVIVSFMEGPSLVIATEEFAPFKASKVSRVGGTAKIPLSKLRGSIFEGARSWGKHFILSFATKKSASKADLHLRIHFLMFGSYRIDDPRENRIPKLEFTVNKHRFYFYSCAIRVIDEADLKKYDWSVDLMSKKWNHEQAVKNLSSKPNSMVCDILLDQTIFAGLGNIIKNEVLYRVRLHPETRISQLTPKKLRELVKEAHNYSHEFYQWKKINELKRHWLIMRKKDCPEQHGKLVKKATGQLQRLSHYCLVCQPLPKRQLRHFSRQTKLRSRKAIVVPTLSH